MDKKIMIAPVQGHTDAAWRHFHHEVYGGENLYFTPFIRCERGDFRQHDLKDFTSPLNDGLLVEPQVIFRDIDELDILVGGLATRGACQINLNMGCPFPLQTGKGRGAGFLAHPDEAAKIPSLLLQKYPEISFSVKMRLGYDDATQWKRVIDTLNEMPLRFVAVHPRIARQQYGGDLDLEQFGELLHASKAPVIFNGELKTPADVDAVIARFPEIEGVMLGRGLLGRPSLAAEIPEGKEWTPEERIAKMKEMHTRLLRHYSDTLCGETQLLGKIKPFWEYAEEEIGRKAWKAIKKSTTLPKYRTALTLI